MGIICSQIDLNELAITLDGSQADDMFLMHEFKEF